MKRRNVTECTAEHFTPEAKLVAIVNGAEFVGSMDVTLPEHVRVPLDAYLSNFAAPDADGTCLKCGERLSYAFVWAIAHGEGYCRKCKWPTRLYHYLKLGTDEREIRYVKMLQYHPKLVKRKRTA